MRKSEAIATLEQDLPWIDEVEVFLFERDYSYSLTKMT